MGRLKESIIRNVVTTKPPMLSINSYINSYDNDVIKKNSYDDSFSANFKTNSCK